MTPDSALAADVAPSPNFGDRRGKTVDALILHYTGMSTGLDALAWLRNPASGVSCHYFVWEDGRVVQLVAEADRAWHAGRSYWAGETDLNSLSIGIEIVNGGHVGGLPPYPDRQIDAVVALCRDVCGRYRIPPRRVLAHSDIAPARKEDPGERFPWGRLAEAGIALAVEAPAPDDVVVWPGDRGPVVFGVQQRLAGIGYDVPQTGCFDEATVKVVIAFQRRFRPARCDGQIDTSTLWTIESVLGQTARA